MAFNTVQRILLKHKFPCIKYYRDNEIRQRAELEVNKRIERTERERQMAPPDIRRRGDYSNVEPESPRRNRRSRSRSRSPPSRPTDEQLVHGMSQKTLQIKRYASSRQEYIEPLIEQARDNGADYDRDRLRTIDRYRESDGRARERDRDSS